jgi:hypothetical protein
VRPCSKARAFGAEHQKLPARVPAPQLTQSFTKAGEFGLLRARGGGQPHGVADQIFRDRHLADQFVEPQHILAGEQRLNGRGRRAVVCWTTATSSLPAGNS